MVNYLPSENCTYEIDSENSSRWKKLEETFKDSSDKRLESIFTLEKCYSYYESAVRFRFYSTILHKNYFSDNLLFTKEEIVREPYLKDKLNSKSIQANSLNYLLYSLSDIAYVYDLYFGANSDKRVKTFENLVQILNKIHKIC